MPDTQRHIIQELQREILLLQGFKPPSASSIDMGLGPVTAAFPNGVFPTGAVHEFLSTGPGPRAASGGFVAALIAPLMTQGGVCIWVGSGQKVFPPGLRVFGVTPDRIIFIEPQKEKEALWIMEEALACEGLAAVVGEVQEMGFTASRRLQLAVEQSRVTGFVLRHNPRNINPIAAVARWRITPLPSEPQAGMPGIGFPRWNVELARIRNGQPGTWQMEWRAGHFHQVTRPDRTQETVRPARALEPVPRTATFPAAAAYAAGWNLAAESTRHTAEWSVIAESNRQTAEWTRQTG